MCVVVEPWIFITDVILLITPISSCVYKATSDVDIALESILG